MSPIINLSWPINMCRYREMSRRSSRRRSSRGARRKSAKRNTRRRSRRRSRPISRQRISKHGKHLYRAIAEIGTIGDSRRQQHTPETFYYHTLEPSDTFYQKNCLFIAGTHQLSLKYQNWGGGEQYRFTLPHLDTGSLHELTENPDDRLYSLDELCDALRNNNIVDVHVKEGGEYVRYSHEDLVESLRSDHTICKTIRNLKVDGGWIASSNGNPDVLLCDAHTKGWCQNGWIVSQKMLQLRRTPSGRMTLSFLPEGEMMVPLSTCRPERVTVSLSENVGQVMETRSLLHSQLPGFKMSYNAKIREIQENYTTRSMS